MSRFETILVGTDDPFDRVVATLARALGTDALDVPGGRSDAVMYVLDTTADISIEDVRLDEDPSDDPGYADIRYEVYVRDTSGPARQLETANRVYDRIVAHSPWKVVLLGTDDLPAATREAITATSA